MNYTTIKLRPDTLKKMFSRSTQDPQTGCRVWQGQYAGDNYAQLYIGTSRADNRKDYLHRISHQEYIGSITGSVYQTCGNRLCWNPAHLAQSSVKEKTARVLATGRANHWGKKAIVLPVPEVVTALLAGETIASLARRYKCSCGPIRKIKRKYFPVTITNQDPHEKR